MSKGNTKSHFSRERSPAEPPSAPCRRPPAPAALAAAPASSGSAARRRQGPARHVQAAQDGRGERCRGSLARRPRDGRLGQTGRAGFQTMGISNQVSQAQRGEIHRCGAHVADEPTPRVVGLVASEYLLATTGRCNRRWDGRQLEMTEETCNNRLMGDGSNDPQ
jgi:hypothetical protein